MFGERTLKNSYSQHLLKGNGCLENEQENKITRVASRSSNRDSIPQRTGPKNHKGYPLVGTLLTFLNFPAEKKNITQNV